MRKMINILMTLATLVVAIILGSCSKSDPENGWTGNVNVQVKFRTIPVHDTITIKEIVFQRDSIFLPGDTVITVVEKEVIKYITVHDTVTVENNFTGYRTGTPLVTGKGIAQMPEFKFVNGELVSTNYLTANFKFNIQAGNAIEVASEPTLASTSATISGDKFSYKYYAGGNIADSWKVTSDNRVAFQTQGGTKYYTIPEYAPVSLAFYNAGENQWEHLAAATINNIIQDSDIQELYIKAKDEPKPEYNLIINHKSASINASAMQIIDTHNAYLVDGESVVENATYDALHQVSFTQSNKIEYEAAKEMEKNSFTITNGMVKVNNIIFKVSVKTADCDAITMATNNTTYCHPAFPVDGAVAALSCCSLEGKTLKTASITGNELPGEIIIGDNDGDNIPVTIPIVIEVIPPTPPADTHGVEFADVAEVSGPNSSTLIAYPTINGVRTGEEVKLTSNFSGSLKAGAQINKTSNGSVNLSSTTAQISGNNASFDYILDGESFSDAWSWELQANASFTYERNGVKETVTRPIKADVAVKSTSFTADNGTYRNTASLYANGFAINADSQVIVVSKPEEPSIKPLIDGYTVISSYITTCYHNSSNGSLVSDGNHLAIVLRKNDDATQYIIRRANMSDGSRIEDHHANNVDESQIFSFRGDANMAPAYLEVTKSAEKAIYWEYVDIDNGNSYFPVNRDVVINNRLPNPVIEVGKIIDGIMTIGGLKIK